MSTAPSILPTELGLQRALAVARWGSWMWTCGVVVFGGDDLVRPAVATIAVAAAFVVAVVGTIGARGAPWISGWPFALAQAGVAAALVLADGWAFSEGHVFATSQNLAAASPAIAAANIGIAGGAGAGLAAGSLLGTMRLPSALLNGVDELTGPRWASLTSSFVYGAIAGAITGWLATTLRRTETEVVARRERESIARTLHDTVLQTLAIVRRRTDDRELAELARRTDREVRTFLYGPVDQPERTLTTAVQAAAGRAAAGFEVAVEVNVVDGDEASGAGVDAIATAVGEAVTNAGKHASPQRIVVYAETDEDGALFASVRDDGTGFDVGATSDTVQRSGQAGTGQGMRRSLRDPIEAAGGRVEIESRDGVGTEVRMWVP